MNQQVTFQVNTKSLVLMMGAFMLTIAATILLALGLVVPSIVQASTNQTANANPVFQVPSGYTLVPTVSGSCASGSAASAQTSITTTPEVMSYYTVVPGMHYNSTVSQVHNETHTKYEDSFNTKGDTLINSNVGENINSGNGSNNGNNNNNGNFSNNFSNNTATDSFNTTNNTDNSQVNTVINTTTTTVNTNSNNEILSNNSLNVGAGGAGGGTE